MDMMDEITGALLDSFRDEAREMLADMESALMELEERPGDAELVARAFRALHTIKGNCSMFGFEELESFAHELEHIFDLLRKGRLAVSREIVELALGSKDRLLACLTPGGDSARERDLREEIVRRIAHVVGGEKTASPVVSPAPGEASPTADPAERGDTAPAHLVEVFREEARELLAELEGALLEVESHPADAEPLERAFRILHTIKGNSGMFGFDELEAFAHGIETVFDQLRQGELLISPELVGLGLDARDRMLRLLDGTGDTEEERASRERTSAGLGALAERGAPAAREVGGPATWHIVFRPEGGIFAAGTDPLVVIDELRGLGHCRAEMLTDALPPLEGLDPERCYLGWDLYLTTEKPVGAIRDAFIFFGEGSTVDIEPAGPGQSPPPETAVPKPPEPRPEATAPAEGGAEVAVSSARQTIGTLRVGAAKLDSLVNLVGELVTVQARLSRLGALRADPELTTIAEEVERLTGELRDGTLSIRMVPVGPAFGKFRRLVRDLSIDVGREVNLVLEGEETELDKSVIDRLNDPIIHLLRNSIDHGLEPPGDRAAAGKPLRGTIRLTAGHAGGSVVITVRDDGRGVDAAVVRRRAVERGQLPEGDLRPDHELYALMFQPGFSTSSRVTNLSGRGVGLDVVKRAVEALRGTVRIESAPGQGTTFELRLPLTLAIIEGLEVVLGEERFIIPLASVKECVELTHREGESISGRGVVEIRGALVPYVRLRDWFAVPGTAPLREQIVITEHGGFRVGFVVDHVVGEQQTVIKPLGRSLGDVRGLAGATILGDGSVSLILDVPRLVQGVEDAAAESEPGASAHV